MIRLTVDPGVRWGLGVGALVEFDGALYSIAATGPDWVDLTKEDA